MKNTKTAPTANPYVGLPPAGVLRRFGALIYDALLVMALMLLAGGVGALVAALLLNFNLISIAGYPDMAAYLSQNMLYQIWIWSVFVGFYAFFWSKAGQTLGMRAWKLRVQNEDGTNINKTQAVIRLFTAIFGLGNFFVLINKPKGRSFQDHWADCEVVLLSKELNQQVKLKGVKWP
ncbi:RDD family protein [Motilimonas pumila]|uniref:RDD family protein n=1 Tax=Motilimonas pumila TaxID=2303987 RepID=A0A418YKL0_9GAMM|nr:RDD family protein [Motilimonas pumila]RJG51524.1 RDD family protein [Motilimonas pumila]